MAIDSQAMAANAATAAWQNPVKALDVNGDGFISPIDALIVINKINRDGLGPLPAIDSTHAPPPYYDADGDGNLFAIDALLVINRLNDGRGGPKLQAALTNDTAPGGTTNNDRITSDPSVTGKVTVSHGIGSLLSFKVSLDGLPGTIDLLGRLAADGSFTLSQGDLDQLAGGGIPDGAHTVHLVAQDELAYTTRFDLPFTLDRFAPAPSVPQLAPGSDSGANNADNLTNVSTPAFNVGASPGSQVTIYVDGQPAANGPAGQPIAVPQLADGSHQIQAAIIDAAGNVSGLSAALTIRIVTTPPSIDLSLLPSTQDVTPNFRISASGPLPLADGTTFHIDVDLNNDGVFSPDELDNTVATLFNGRQEMQLATPLPRADQAPYAIGVRARLTDAAGNEGASAVQPLLVSTQSNDILKNYVALDDGAFGWSLVGQPIQGTGYTAYVLNMTSQRWRLASDFTADETLWQHYVTIVVPNGAVSSTALLFVDGGHKDDPAPTAADFASGSNLDMLAQEAVLARAIVVHLPNVPREPVTFADETTSRSEDAIIAYTFDKFLDNPDPNTDWPLLLPMVKSAVKAMDATQQFLQQQVPADAVDKFVVTGASKRGWTTWLTAAIDNRVVGIVPMVFDALNLGEQMVHHFGVYDGFSPAIAPYENEHVFERILTLPGLELGKIVDPFSYLNNGRFNIPKLGINSTGDQFFVSDSAQYYFHDLPGSQNYLLYVPNSSHSLDISQGQNSLTAQGILSFFNAIIHNLPLPQFSWQIQDNGAIRVQTVTQPLQVKLWQATNPVTRDFRKDYTDPSVVKWTSTTLVSQGGGVYLASVPVPATGATAYYVELDFPSPLPFPYRFTTELRVATNLALYPWPFTGGPGSAVADSPQHAPGSTSGAEALASPGTIDTALLAAASIPISAPSIPAPPSSSAPRTTGSPTPAVRQVQAVVAGAPGSNDSSQLRSGSGGFHEPTDVDEAIAQALDGEWEELLAALVG